MKAENLEVIFRALEEAKVRYLVVGGLAVVAHGYQRLTHDLDFAPESLAKALEVFTSLGYQPRISADLSDFAHPHRRENWQREKGLKVFNIFSLRYPDITIDLFPESPFPFADEYAVAPRFEMASDLKIPIISIEQLITMKLTANRPQDHIDVEKLRKIQQLSDHRE